MAMTSVATWLETGLEAPVGILEAACTFVAAGWAGSRTFAVAARAAVARAFAARTVAVLAARAVAALAAAAAPERSCTSAGAGWEASRTPPGADSPELY